MIIRLYLDEHFTVGQRLKLPSDELRYHSSVRRGRGDVELFNRQGQVARGKREGQYFQVLEVVERPFPLQSLSIALALPETKVLRECVLSLSELGVERLIVFEGERSQSAASRLKQTSKWEKWAIESARQCGRSPLLQVQASGFDEILKLEHFEERWVLDESPEATPPLVTKADASRLVLVGCEGGWSSKERSQIQKAGFAPIHLSCPVLRVQTACIAAATMGLWAKSSGAAPL